MRSYLLRLVLLLAFSLVARHAVCHEHGDHKVEEQTPANSSESPTDPNAVTGSGDLTFRYRADLSALPEAINAGIVHAHGGFARAPSGEIYFGLEATGVVRVSADLTEKSIICDAPEVRVGGLHNTTYVDQLGGVVVLPDNGLGEIHAVNLQTGAVHTVGRPGVNEYYNDAENPYAPTDTDTDPEGRLFVCDGYSPGKYVLNLELQSGEYGAAYFGGPVAKGEKTPGKFSTNHGITYDPEANAFWIADRERHWAQLISPEGDFIRGVDMAGAMVCDVDLIEWDGRRLMVAGCLKGADGDPGVVHLLQDEEIVSTLRPKLDLGLNLFDHVHNAIGVVVDGKLYILCYGWNPGCYAVLEHVKE